MIFFSFAKKALFRLLKLFGANRVAYKLSKSTVISFDSQKVNEARAFLENYSPNPQTSCVCINKIEPQVDIHIIIPAYNVEAYIKECLDSIVLNPTKKYTYLVTVINDGSVDNTSKIIKQYEDYSCVEVINQPNKGFSGARNTGLAHIRGRYILFVDSDDMMDWRGVEKMMDAALETGADIVRGAHTVMLDNGGLRRFIANSTGNIETTKLGGGPCTKLFRSELFNDVCFPEHYWYEDSIFDQIVYPRISIAWGINENAYYHRNRLSGITNQGIKKAKSIDSYWITEQLFHERAKYGLEITNQYYDYVLHMVKLTFSRIRLQSYDVKKNVFILFCDFIDRNFSNFNSHNAQYKEIEKIIKTRDLGKCISYARWM